MKFVKKLFAGCRNKPDGVNAMDNSRRHYLFDGRVQGVGFRFSAKMFADTIGLTGWIMNCYDGKVEMEIQGTEEQIDRMIGKLLNSKSIQITDMKMDLAETIKEDKFIIRY